MMGDHRIISTGGNALAALQGKALKSRRETNMHEAPGALGSFSVDHLI